MIKKQNMFLMIGFLIAIFISMPSNAQIQSSEHIFTFIPKNYEIGYQVHDENQYLTEYVPKGQTVENWQEMITIRQFQMKLTAEEIAQSYQKKWAIDCPVGGVISNITNQQTSGYPSSAWMMSCPEGKVFGKPEYTWFKSIRGNDVLYVVHYSYRHIPSATEKKRTQKYLQNIIVCNTKSKKHPCTASR
jgi:hypothetical protein